MRQLTGWLSAVFATSSTDGEIMMRRLASSLLAVVWTVLALAPISAQGKPQHSGQFFTSETAFLKAAGKVSVESFEAFPTEQCALGGTVETIEVVTPGFIVNTRVYILEVDSTDTVFLCVGTAAVGDTDPRPTEGVNALVAGSKTGSTYVLEFLLTEPTRAVGFDFTDVAETGDFFFVQPDTGAQMTIAPCCSGPHDGFFGYVAKQAFTRFYLFSSGRSDGLGLDRIQLGHKGGKNVSP